MKSIFLVLITLIPSMVLNAFAQSVNAYADVNLSIHGGISLTKIRDLRMGAVVQGTTSVSINPLSSGSAAYFIVSACPNSAETITFSSTNLTSGSSTIIFTGVLAGSDQPIQPHSILIGSGDAITTSSTGDFYLWAGGSATLASKQPTGDYVGSFTVSIIY